MSEPLLIFLSYDKASEPEVIRLKAELERLTALRAGRGKFHIFRDGDDINPGDDFAETLNRALTECAIGLICVTDSIIWREWCVKEIIALDSRRKSGEPVRIIPVVLQDDSDIFPDAKRSVAELQKREERYQDSLSEDQKNAVSILRALHIFKGSVFVDKNPNDGPYTDAADDLAAEFVRASRDPEIIAWIDRGKAPAKVPVEDDGNKPRVGRLAIGGLALVGVAAISIYVANPVDPVDPNPFDESASTDPEVPASAEPEWTAADGGIIVNGSGVNIPVFSTPDDGTPVEQIAVNAVRPDPDAPPEVERATIDGVEWIRFRTVDNDWLYLRDGGGVRIDP